MRVIAGSAKGRRLASPGPETRPMTDRAREALFSILGESIEGARVLDLYCGSGSLSCEALSRGASESTLIDRSANAIRTATENLDKCGFNGRFVAIRSEAYGYLAAMTGAPYELVFLDPPYAMPESEVMDQLERLKPRICDGGMVMVHRDARTQSEHQNNSWPSGYRSTLERKYGGVLLRIGVRTIAADEARATSPKGAGPHKGGIVEEAG